MKVNVEIFLVGVTDPKEYDFVNKDTGERISGVTRRATIIVKESKEAMTVKITEEEFASLAALPMMTEMVIKFVPSKRLRVENGRAIEEFYFKREGFELVGKNAKVA